jgi:16S rRNA G966 N2-methylase RsmD
MAMDEDGRVFGMWTMGNDYRVKSGYHGGYPATYLRRVKALFPDKKAALHVFSGKVDVATFPGDTVDVRAELEPTFVDDCQTLESVPLEKYDIVLADPPYSGEDADKYGTTMVNRNRVMTALARVRPGTHVVWLDQVLPIYRKDTWIVDAEVGIRRSTNHRFREMTVFRRAECPAPSSSA